MCGRFTQTKSRKETIEALGDIELPPLFHGRYNVAPTQKVAIIKQQSPAKAEESIWGFTANTLVINARRETLAERPMFRDLLNTNRCLIPADGFYEWQGRQPHYFQLPDKQLFAFAGLWHQDRCVIITRAANADMRGIHDRIPVILPISRWSSWLKNSLPPEPPTLHARPVSRRVNSVANDDPSCLAGGEVQTDLSLFPAGE